MFAYLVSFIHGLFHGSQVFVELDPIATSRGGAEEWVSHDEFDLPVAIILSSFMKSWDLGVANKF